MLNRKIPPDTTDITDTIDDTDETVKLATHEERMKKVIENARKRKDTPGG